MTEFQTLKTTRKTFHIFQDCWKRQKILSSQHYLTVMQVKGKRVKAIADCESDNSTAAEKWKK